MADGAGGWALCNAYGLPKATLDLNGNENVTNNGQRFEIGIVKGEGKLHGVWNAGLKDAGSQNTWVLGTLNKNFTLDAKISGNSMLEKTGTGKMNVTSACDHSGGTQIKSGELCINRNNTSVAALGTGDIYVTKGAMLSGKGVVGGNVIISSGATLRPGVSPTSILGALYLKGKDITINRGATLLFCAKTASLYTRIKDVGTLQIKGTLVVNVTDDASFDIGDEITLWDAEELVLGKDVTYQLATPGEGLAWDTSKITKGILTIISDATSITAPRQSESGHTFYDLSGKKVHEPFRGITISKKKKILKTF
jgi:autotransporter-associated beta strand protein